jgi:hypothetical protein
VTSDLEKGRKQPHNQAVPYGGRAQPSFVLKAVDVQKSEWARDGLLVVLTLPGQQSTCANAAFAYARNTVIRSCESGCAPCRQFEAALQHSFGVA